MRALVHSLSLYGDSPIDIKKSRGGGRVRHAGDGGTPQRTRIGRRRASGGAECTPFSTEGWARTLHGGVTCCHRRPFFQAPTQKKKKKKKRKESTPREC